MISIGLTWLATRHPLVGATIAAGFVLVIVVLIRTVWRAVGALFRGAERVFQT